MITNFEIFLTESENQLLNLIINTHKAALKTLGLDETDLTGVYTPKLENYVVYMNSILDQYATDININKEYIINGLESTNSVLLNYIFLKYFDDDRLETKFVKNGFRGGDNIRRYFINPMIVQNTKSGKTFEQVLKILQNIIADVCETLKTNPNKIWEKITNDVFATKFIRAVREAMRKHNLLKYDTITYSAQLQKELLNTNNSNMFVHGAPFFQFFILADYIENPKTKKVYMQNKTKSFLNYELI